MERAIVGGGCFWCIEAAFHELQGVERVTSGYAAGSTSNPDYHSVCAGKSGHAEVVEIVFDPSLLAFSDILDVFFAIHDPTTLNRQGNDIGTQYRSIIIWQDAQQAQIAAEKLLSVQAGLSETVVTELHAPCTFYPAENYHQRYFQNNPQQPYCDLVVAPKLIKFRKRFADRLKSEPS